MSSPSFSDRDAALREQMRGPRRMAEPKDMDAFWQRQRAEIQGRIEPMEPVKAPSRTPIWIWMIAVPLVGVAVISLL